MIIFVTDKKLKSKKDQGPVPILINEILSRTLNFNTIWRNDKTC